MDVLAEAAGGAQERTEGETAADLRAMAPNQQRRVILEMVRAGQSDTQIGARFELSPWQVRNLRYRLGVKKDRGGRVRRTAAGRTQAHSAATAGTMRLPRLAAAVERMGVRMAGLFSAEEAGGRLTALGGLLSSSEGRYEVRVAIHQVADSGGR